jgi:hypothetical protein
VKERGSRQVSMWRRISSLISEGRNSGPIGEVLAAFENSGNRFGEYEAIVVRSSGDGRLLNLVD